MPREHRTRAVVLRTFDQGESDRVVHFYTERLGRVSAIAKGARRSKRRFPGALEVFNVLEIRLVDPPRSSMMRLEGAKLVRAAEGMPRVLARYAIACEFVELVDRATLEGDANPAFYRFCEGVMRVLDDEPPDRLLAVLVPAKALALLGYRPQLVTCTRCDRSLAGERGRVGFAAHEGGAVCRACCAPEEARTPAPLLAALEAGLRTPLRERGNLGLDRADVRRLERLFERFFRFFIGFELRSQAFRRQAVEAIDGRGSPGDTAPALAAKPGPAQGGGGSIGRPEAPGDPAADPAPAERAVSRPE